MLFLFLYPIQMICVVAPDVFAALLDGRPAFLQMERIRGVVLMANPKKAMAIIHLFQQTPIMACALRTENERIIFLFYDSKMFLVNGLYVCIVYHNMSKIPDLSR